MITRQAIHDKREAILEIARRHGAHHVRLFGSMARGDAAEASDVDLLVRFDLGRSLFDHGGLIADLQEFLGIKVDVVSEGGLRPRMARRILSEAVPV